jgi:hypothetical protein
MRITNKTLQVNFEHDVTVGNAIEATLVHIAFISENNKTGDIDIDLDFADIDNVKFMGIPIGDGYENYRKFKKTMSELGIDIAETFNFKAKELITDENMETLKQLYRNTVK